MRLILWLLLPLLLVTCRNPDTVVVDPDCTVGATISGSEADDQHTLDAMEVQIQALLDRKCSNENKCRTIGLGSKPCGGPWTYLIYSDSSTDEAKLIEMVCEYNAYQSAMNGHYGYISDCAVIEPPQLNCNGGRCEIAY